MKKVMTALVLLILVFLGLWGYDVYKVSSIESQRLDAIEQAKHKGIELAKSVLKDPASALFEDVRAADGTSGVCGRVNAKNSYGGYTGFKLFFSSDGQVYIDSDPLSPISLKITSECTKLDIAISTQKMKELGIDL